MQGLEKIVVTFSGEAGTGKTSTANAVAEKLGLKFFSAGAYARKLADRQHTDIQHMARFANTAFDDFVDGETQEFATQYHRVVLDGRIAHIYFPDAIKIYITCPLEIRAQRRAKDNNISELEAMRQLSDRDEADRERLWKLRGVNFLDQSQYTAVFTSTKPKEEFIDEVRLFIANTLAERITW